MNYDLYKCKNCNNIFVNISEGDKESSKEFEKLIPNTTEASHEKHIPVVEFNNNTVTVTIGEVIHPMTLEHHIEFIIIITSEGFKMKKLNINEEPKAVFNLNPGELFVKALEYCNLHGLWSYE